jgi:hypothetical protein
MTLSAERLRELLDYDPETGVFRWKAVSSKNQVRVGDVAGCVETNGYRRIRVYGRAYQAHRLAWLHVYGRWPVGEIDHINGAKDDNRISNLREATRSENLQNQRRATRGSKTGFLGVYPSFGKFGAQIMLAGKTRHIGTFETAEQAHAAYVRAKRELHPGGTL